MSRVSPGGPGAERTCFPHTLREGPAQAIAARFQFDPYAEDHFIESPAKPEDPAKPQDWPYSKQVSLNRDAVLSAAVTMAFIESGMTTRNTPPK